MFISVIKINHCSYVQQFVSFASVDYWNGCNDQNGVIVCLTPDNEKECFYSMALKSSRQKACHKYEEKRKKTPRFGGYLTNDEKVMFTETQKLGNFRSEKEMIIAAVAKLHEKLSG